MDLAELTGVLMCVCLDVREWLWASAYCISSPTLLHSSSEVLELWVGADRPPRQNCRLFFFCPPSRTQTASLYVHSSFRVSCYEAVGSPLCPAKAAPLLFAKPFFFFFFFFYPCANRRGRVPELDPIFHARLSIVWHTAPDKNPSSRASLILKSNGGAERAFNHPLSVLQ